MARLSHYIVFWLAFLSTALPSTMNSLPTSEHTTRENAFQIFNAIHSAMRQWGSSLNHNGMSFFLATVPEGQLLYHGSHNPKGKNGFDWLAFEVEHAQAFAQSRDPDAPDVRLPPLPPCKEPLSREASEASSPRLDCFKKYGREEQGFDCPIQPRPSLPLLQYHQGQKPIARSEDDDGDEPCLPPRLFKRIRGYLHTYRAARPLHLLYLDGMAAAKVQYGTLDTQDVVLLDWPPDSRKGEGQRAAELCAMVEEWAREDKNRGKIDGFVRMEAGFEIIYCDFANGAGLDLIDVRASPFWNETGGSTPQMPATEWERGVAMRNHGMPVGRIEVDWSSMVSAFFYDVNLTNPDASRPELPRVISMTKDERRGIRARIREVVAARYGWPSTVGWQGVVDMIVSRFSSRLAMLANIDMDANLSRSLVNVMLNPYIDYESTKTRELLLESCTRHYVESATLLESSWTQEDRLIYTAVETVTKEICSSFIQFRDILNNGTNEGRGQSDTRLDEEEVSEKVRKVASDLIAKLQWTTWKECGECSSADEYCFVAMFPFGSVEEHFSPRCKNGEATPRDQNYWAQGSVRSPP